MNKANGIYRISKEVMFSESESGEKLPISVYINDNNLWVLFYDDTHNKWKLQSLENEIALNENIYIYSNNEKISDGFLATRENNNGFFDGSEIIQKGTHTSDDSGFIRDETGKVVGKLFQTGIVNVNNNFNFIANSFYFKDKKDEIGNFLIWRIVATSLKNKNISYEVPVVYLNASSETKNILSMYDTINDKLSQLILKQSTESDNCTEIIANSMFWGLNTNSETHGMVSDEIKIPCFGQTYLDIISVEKNDTEGKYFQNINGINHISKSSCKFEYEEVIDSWKILNTDTNEIYRKSVNHPVGGTYRSTTKNIIGRVRYVKNDTMRKIELKFQTLQMNMHRQTDFMY